MEMNDIEKPKSIFYDPIERKKQITNDFCLKNIYIQQFVLIPDLPIEHLYMLNIDKINLWVVETYASSNQAVDSIFVFLRSRKLETEPLSEYILLVTPDDKKTQYRYLTSGINSKPFIEIYGKILPTIEEFKFAFPQPQNLMAWLAARSEH